MRYLLLSIILLFNQYFSYSQYNYKNYNTLNEKPKIENTYLNPFPEKQDENKSLYVFNFTSLNIIQNKNDSTYEKKPMLDYGLEFDYGMEFDYNYDLNNNQLIDISLGINTTFSNTTLSLIKISLIIYF